MKQTFLKIFLVVLLLGSLPLVFQNCSKLKTEEIVCDENSSDDCSLANAKSSPISLTMSEAKVEVFVDGLNYAGATIDSFQVDLATDEVSISGQSANCSLSANNHWQKFKSLILSRGVCNYTYSTPPGTVTCMGMAMPYARIMNGLGQDNQGIFLSNSICMQSHNEVCGAENVQAFRHALMKLNSEMVLGKACDEN
jgi:hypothetical protein